MKNGYRFLALVLSCFLIMACGGGAEDIIAPPMLTDFFTGNQDYKVEDSENADPLNDYRVDDTDSNTLPERIDHSDKLPQVRSQGTTSSCTSWAVGYYGKTTQEVMEENWNPTQNAFSPSFLYAMQCRSYDKPWNVQKAWETLNRHGIAKWDTLPFEDLSEGGGKSETEKNNYANIDIPKAAMEEARIYRCGEMTHLHSLVAYKRALTNGPIVLAINEYDSPPENVSPEENYMHYNPAKTDRGHAILCVGYDNQKFGEGAVKFVNSWGTSFGENGFSWIRYSDLSNIVMSAISYKDIPNPNNNVDPADNTERPDAPTDVQASDDEGNYVDIIWNPVSNAHYYRIYRAPVDGSIDYTDVGVSYQSRYRDYPTPGVQYYYAVVGVNDLGTSDHYPSDTDAQSHVDIGSAIGDVLTTPTLQWDYNDDDGSHFKVSNIDPAATAMEVFVSTASEGPWDSLGWVNPNDFTINWGDDSEYGNKAPYVRVRVANSDASSSPSAAVQVGENIDNNTEVGGITVYMVTPREDSILMRWMGDGGKVDFYEIWRYRASEDDANDWIKIGYTDPSVKDDDNFNYYADFSALPGVSYYYVVVPVYNGTYGELTYSEQPYKIEDSGTNLHMTRFQYLYGQISNPTRFPLIEIRNNGSTRVDEYTISVLAYDRNEQRGYLLQTYTINDTPLDPGQETEFHIAEFNIDSRFANGHAYSWGMAVDYEDSISETYEDDNLIWSTDTWWLPQAAGSGENVRESGEQSRLGSSRPFSHKSQINRSIDIESRVDEAEDLGNGLTMLYNGPSIFHKPDFCNSHSNQE